MSLRSCIVGLATAAGEVVAGAADAAAAAWASPRVVALSLW